MCLAIPVKVIELRDNNRALVDLGGISKEISLALVKDVAVNDYVITHVGFALAKLNEEEALKTLTLLEELVQS